MKQPTIYDPYPAYQPAGYRPKLLNEGADQCIRPEDREGPGTPEHIKRYRKSTKNATGHTITHYGKVYDPLPGETFTYGKGTDSSEHVPQVFNDKEVDGIKGYMRDLREEKYARTKNEPLGQTISRNYKWPEEITSQPGFRFGVGTQGSESAKDVMYAGASLNNGQQDQKNYIKSHGMWEAGQQKKRDYNWPFDPSNQVFGKTEKLVADEGRLCLQPETANTTFPKTQIVQKNVEDFRDYNREPLGKPKNLAQTNPYVTSDQVYGFKPKDKEPWDAAKCIRGEAIYNQVKEDEALGKATRSGFKNTVKSGDEDRVFGVPTIRNDIQKPNMRSIADPNNYGDEPNSVGLLFPQRFSEMGVSKEDFEALRSKEQIRTLFANIGYAYKPGKFEGIFMRAQQLCGSYGDQVSASAFIQAIKEMDHLE